MISAGTIVEKCLNETDIAVLAGGMGTRLRGVLDHTPKVLAEVAGRPFLDHLFDYLQGFGARRVVLCLGHLSGHVTRWLQQNPRSGLDVIPAIEGEPAGTAGALRLARGKLKSDPVLVINGDTFVDADLCDFLRHHGSGNAGLSLLCTKVDSIDRYGSVEIDADSRIQGFHEKVPGRSGPGTINTGYYLISASMLDRLATGQGPSLERDFLPGIPAGTILAHVTDCRFIDIGTPESLAGAADVLFPVRG